MRLSFAPRGPRAGRKKNPAVPPTLAGPESLQLREPQDHALGRSQGGFGTKVHLACDGHGVVLAVWLTPGQRHESQAFALVLLRAKRPRRAGRRRWPRRVAADLGYSYNGSQFTQTAVFCTSPNGGLDGIWMAGKGLAADLNGNRQITGDGLQ